MSNADKYYFDGIAKAGRPRFVFRKVDPGNKKYYMIAAAAIPVQVGIFVDNFTVSVSSQFNIRDGNMTPTDIIINFPSRPYTVKDQNTQQDKTMYDPYIKFDSRDLAFDFVNDIKAHFVAFWNTNKAEYFKLISGNNGQSGPEQTTGHASQPAGPPQTPTPSGPAPQQAAPPAEPPSEPNFSGYDPSKSGGGPPEDDLPF